MRLAVFTNQFPAQVSTFFARDMRALQEAGVDVEVFPIYPLDASLWRYVPDILDEKILSRDKVHHINLLESFRLARPITTDKLRLSMRELVLISASAARFGPGPLVKSLYVIPKAWAWAQLYAHRFDHILAYWGNYVGTCAYLFHHLLDRRIPYSIFFHAGTDLYRNRVYLRQKLATAEKIITCSEFNRNFLLQHYSGSVPSLERKIHVYHHGLDFSEFPFTPNNRLPRRILAVGRLDKRKGYDNLLQAAYILKQRGLRIEVELIGDGAETPSLRTLTEKLGISDRVIFRGWLRFDEVQKAMIKATLLVHPSSGLGDGIPNVIKEAMAVGLPVIASDVSGIPEAIDGEQSGVLVPPKDINALANAIATLLAEEERRDRLVFNARKLSEKKFDLWQNGQVLANVLA